MRDIIDFALFVFLSLAVVPVLDGAIVAGDTAVDLGGGAAVGALEFFACDVAVVAAYGVSGRKSIIGQLVVICDLSDKVGGSSPIRQLLAEEGMEYGA